MDRMLSVLRFEMDNIQIQYENTKTTLNLFKHLVVYLICQIEMDLHFINIELQTQKAPLVTKGLNMIVFIMNLMENHFNK